MSDEDGRIPRQTLLWLHEQCDRIGVALTPPRNPGLASDLKHEIDPWDWLPELVAEVLQVRDEVEVQQTLLDLRQRADQRAIARWRQGHPERALRQPDHADLVVWLMGELDRLEGAET